jgi:hypothetical protein
MADRANSVDRAAVNCERQSIADSNRIYLDTAGELQVLTRMPPPDQ